MIEEAENMDVSLRNQAYETAWRTHISRDTLNDTHMLQANDPPKPAAITRNGHVQTSISVRHQDD